MVQNEFGDFMALSLVDSAMLSENKKLFELLQLALAPAGSAVSFSQKWSDEEWNKIHDEALKQLLAGMVYGAVCRLPQNLKPSLGLMFQWASEAEAIKGHNKLLNEYAARLTDKFGAMGRRTAVLKGPANARLYPDPSLRQAGDIDLWVEGGKKSILNLLKQMGYVVSRDDVLSKHHVHLHPTENDIPVEIHFWPSSGNHNPFSNARMQRYLESEILKAEKVPEGFYSPSIRFALVMQMSHIQRHFLGGGIGLKQLTDYYILLQRSSEEDRAEVASHLASFSLLQMSGAVMWIFENLYGLEKEKLLCKSDERRGKMLLEKILDGGNFGRFSKKKFINFIHRFLNKHFSVFGTCWFNPPEVVWCEIDRWRLFARSIPVRIRLRRISLYNNMPE